MKVATMRMLKKRLSSLSTALMLAIYSILPTAGMLIIPRTVSAFTGSGTGTLIDPFIVSDCDDLQSIAVDADANQTSGKYYTLDGNLNCTATASANGGLGFDTIDDFDGIFDGGGFTIDGLTINRPSQDQVGLFGYTSSEAIVANFSMTNVDVTGRSYVGAAVGFSYGNVLGVQASGVVTGASQGNSQGVGGVVGRQQEYSVAGLSRLSFTGTVTNTGPETGGIVGTLGNGTLINSYSDATVNGTDYVGGLVGLVGSCCNVVSDSYANGTVTGDDKVGGVIGSVEGVNTTTIDNLFGAADVTGTTNEGAVIGYVGAASGIDVTIEGLYFDDTASGFLPCYASAALPVTCTGVNSDGLDNQYFQNVSNAPLSSWDFTNDWSIVGSYPVLQSMDELTAPGAVSAISVTYPDVPVDASVQFTAPLSPGSFPVIYYQLELKLAESAWEDVISSESNTISQITVNSLELSTDYTVRVRAVTAYGAGAWTEYSFSTDDQDVIEVADCEELQAVDEIAGSGYAVISLTQNINCSSVENFETLDWGDGFHGNFDGQGFTVSNLTISQVDNNNIGLFSYTENAIIQNVVFDNANIVGTEDSRQCGVIAGTMNETDIYNVMINNASVVCREVSGGIAGDFRSNSHDSVVENVSVTGSIHSEAIEVNDGWGPYLNGGYGAGGIFGQSSASYEGSVRIFKSYSNATVIADQYNAGGLIGVVDTEIDDDSGIPTIFLVQDSYSAGDVSAGTNAGGIFGNMETYNDGYEAISEIEIENSYSSATVTADDSAGGLVGYMDDPNDEGEQYVLNNVFAAGAVSAGTHDYGLIGSNDGLPEEGQGDGALIVTNSYFDQTATGQTQAHAYIDIDLPGTDDDVFYPPEVEGWTAVNTDGSDSEFFKNNSTNSPLNEWDFDSTWVARATDYPTLEWNPESGDLSDQDLNGDNIPDIEQPNIGGYASSITGKIVAIDVGESCELTTDDTTAESNLNVQDAAYEYDNGLWDFEADCGTPGATTAIKLYYYNVDRSNLVLRKHNPNNSSYSTISDAVFTNQTIDGQSVTVVTYQVTDGGDRDTDGLVDGMIKDPAGLARSILSVPNTGLIGDRK